MSAAGWPGCSRKRAVDIRPGTTYAPLIRQSRTSPGSGRHAGDPGAHGCKLVHFCIHLYAFSFSACSIARAMRYLATGKPRFRRGSKQHVSCQMWPLCVAAPGHVQGRRRTGAMRRNKSGTASRTSTDHYCTMIDPCPPYPQGFFLFYLFNIPKKTYLIKRLFKQR